MWEVHHALSHMVQNATMKDEPYCFHLAVSKVGALKVIHDRVQLFTLDMLVDIDTNGKISLYYGVRRRQQQH